MGVPLYSLFLLVDTYITIFVYLIYGRLDITNMRPYVMHNLLHNHSILYHCAYVALNITEFSVRHTVG